MNWDAIGAVGEIVGALAVVVSLLYLAAQVRTQNSESRLAATHEIFEAFRNQTIPFQNPDNAELCVRLINDGFDTLTDAERLQALAIVTPTLRVWEEAYFQHRDGRLEEHVWVAMSRFFADGMSLSAWQDIWKIRCHTFSDEFQAHVNASDAGQYALEISNDPDRNDRSS